MHTVHDSHSDAPLSALRAACPWLQTHIYLANCSQGPLTQPVRAAIETFLEGWASLGMDWNAWVEEVERARAAFAALIGAAPATIAVGTSVSQLVSSLANALTTDAQHTRRKVISSAVEFPGVAHAWLALRKHGWQVEMLPADEQHLVSTSRFVEALDQETALVSVPHVCYAHGALLDVRAVAEAAHAQGVLVLTDAYQSLGAVPIDVNASGVDFLVSGALKYVCGTAGIAFLYVNPALIARLEPSVTGWFGRTNPYAFETTRLDYAPGASRFDLGTPPIINAYTARAGMELILRTGVERIWEQITSLSTLVYELAPQLGLRVFGPQQGTPKGATTALDAGSPERAHWLEEELRQRGVIVSARGRAVRLAPHGFTRAEELEQALQIISRM